MRRKQGSPTRRSARHASFLLLAGLLIGPGRLLAVDDLLENGSFETPEQTGGPGSGPHSFRDWGGDLTEITGAENGIDPFDGSAMLHFLSGGLSGPSGLSSSDARQLVDMTPFAADIAGGKAVVWASGRVNRVAGDERTDTEFRLHLRAYDSGLPYDNQDYLVTVRDSISTDGDPSTWERLTARLLVPASTTFVEVIVSSVENVLNNTSGIEFDGHYADLVSVWVETGEAAVLRYELATAISAKKPALEAVQIALDLESQSLARLDRLISQCRRLPSAERQECRDYHLARRHLIASIRRQRVAADRLARSLAALKRAFHLLESGSPASSGEAG